MAKFEMSGVDRIIDELGRMDALTGPMAEEMIEAGTDVVVETWKRVIKERGHVDWGTMLRTVKARKPPGSGEVVAREVYPMGKDRKGVRNAEKAFILHYGRRGVNGKGEIIGDHFVDQIVNESDRPAVSAMEAVMDKYIKE